MILNGKYKYFRSLGVALDSDFVNFNNMAGYTNNALIYVLNNLIETLKSPSKNYWSRIPKLHFLVSDKSINTDKQNQIKYNLKNPLLYQLTHNGNPTIGNNGYNLNGTNQWADTGFVYSTFFGVTNQDCGLMTAYTGNTLAVCGVIESNSTFRANQTILNNGTATNGCIGRQTGTTSNRPSATGLFSVKSEPGNIQKIFYQNALESSSIVTFQGQPIGTENIGRRGGSVLFYGTSPVALHLTYFSMTDLEVIDLMTILNNSLGLTETALGFSPGTLKKY